MKLLAHSLDDKEKQLSLSTGVDFLQYKYCISPSVSSVLMEQHYQPWICFCFASLLSSATKICPTFAHPLRTVIENIISHPRDVLCFLFYLLLIQLNFHYLPIPEKARKIHTRERYSALEKVMENEGHSPILSHSRLPRNIHTHALRQINGKKNSVIITERDETASTVKGAPGNKP